MPRPKAIEKSTQLLVEGSDQENFFKKLAEHLQLRHIQIQDFGGVNQLREFLSGIFVKAPNFSTVESIGVVRDAESSADAAFQSVKDSLKNAALPVPEEIGRPSSVGNPKVQIMIFPDGQHSGMLETLLCRSFADTPIGRCVSDFIDCARLSANTTSESRLDKARAHAYLATRPFPLHSVGIGAQKGYWPLDHNVFGNVREFMQKL